MERQKKKSKRTSATQLPDIEELQAILETEASRQISEEKIDKHYPEFETCVRWLGALGLQPDFFVSLDSAEISRFLSQREIFTDKLVERTLKNTSQITDELNSVIEYLGGEDNFKKADIIYVFGSRSLSRIDQAVNLYQSGKSSTIFITGGQPFYADSDQKPEAFVYRDYAIEKGVPEDALIIQPGTITLADCVRGGLNYLDEKEISYQSLISVLPWFAQRRGWTHLVKYIPDNTKVFRSNSPVSVDGDLTKDGWFKNEAGIKIVFNEFVKMKISVLINTS